VEQLPSAPLSHTIYWGLEISKGDADMSKQVVDQDSNDVRHKPYAKPTLVRGPVLASVTALAKTSAPAKKT
jgi:hypothetical protein